MATATPDVTAEVFSLILAEDNPPCAQTDCTADARWAMRCATCLHDHQFCDTHRTWLDRNALRRRMHCAINRAVCHTQFPMPLPWRPI